MTTVRENPVDKYLRMERMPSIWCPGCGIGTTVNCFARALDGSGFDLDKVAIVSGIGCTGRVAGYLKLDSFHTTHGRAIPFATGLKLANPELKVVVYSGDGDLSAIGGNHLFHAARRNADLLVVCVNNFTYGMTGGQVTPTTPYPAIASTTPYGAYEETFNLPGVVAAAGAIVRRALDRLPREAAREDDGRGPQQEGLPLHRDHRAVPDAVPPPQQARRGARGDEVLPGEERHQERRRTRRTSASTTARRSSSGSSSTSSGPRSRSRWRSA